MAATAVHGPRLDRERFEWSSLVTLTPALALLGLLFVFPVLYATYLGFTNLALVGSRSRDYSFTGLENVTRMLGDYVFIKSSWLTLIFVVGSAIIGQSVLGMAIALLLRRAVVPVRLIVGSIVIVAWVLPEITVALVWYAFSQAGGTLSILLGHRDANYLVLVPMLIVSVANLWRNVAFSMLVFSAGLRNLPTEVLEAAEVEGASVWRRYRLVILPLMRPTIVTNLLLVTILNLSEFTLIYAMTQGGPGIETMTLPLYVYQEAFVFHQLGYGTAISLVLVLIGAVFSLLFVRAARNQA
ncbi:MAG: multiple sugar transport system permease protein [Chloroflexota bacterium]|nr:multiple sugar transport system permease protein [Chloroflexota bacterium]